VQAASALRSYWGATGEDRTGDSMRTALRTLKLNRADVLLLEDSLPPESTGGPTGDRVRECYRVLRTLS
jgi:hypothetical protein